MQPAVMAVTQRRFGPLPNRREDALFATRSAHWRQSVSQQCQVRARFYRPPGRLARYFTTFYLSEVTIADGGRVTDLLHPEWANLRFHTGSLPSTTTHDGRRITGSSFLATGPSSRALEFEIGSGRAWGVGLLPLGFARFVGSEAADVADTVSDGFAPGPFAAFAPLAEQIFGPEPDEAAELARITAWFAEFVHHRSGHEDQVEAVHAALIDPEVATVASFAARSGLGIRTLERVCRRSFGFTPKVLLRRQRFMRSLAQFMLDPSLTWIGAMDGHYHDQAQFVREFRQFMGLSPSQYARLERPILGPVVRERQRFMGQAVQTLIPPGGQTGAPGSLSAARQDRSIPVG
jgi:AraC-like DNA-binding protein